MSIEDIRLGRGRVAIESGRSAFAISQVGSPSNFLDFPYVEGSQAPTRSWDHLDPQSTEGYLDAQELMVLGKRACSLGLTLHLSGSGTALDGNVAPLNSTNWWMARFLQTIMGGLQTEFPPSAVTQVQAGSTTTVVNVTAGHGFRFIPGRAIGVIVNGRYELREVLSRSTDAISLKVALSAAPTTGTTAIASYTFFLTEDPQNTLQIWMEGYEQSDKFVYLGLQGPIGLNITTAALAQMTVQLSGADWQQTAPATFVAGTLSNYNPVPVVDSEFIVAEVGNTTRNVVACQNQQWSPGINYIPITTPAGVQTMLGWRRGRSVAMTGSFQPYFDSSVNPDWYFDDVIRARLAMFQQIGSSASEGGLVLLSSPTVQIETPQRADNGNLSALSVNWRARHDEALAGTSELLRSAFRIHLFR